MQLEKKTTHKILLTEVETNKLPPVAAAAQGLQASTNKCTEERKL
jgi:hypothetical protein